MAQALFQSLLEEAPNLHTEVRQCLREVHQIEDPCTKENLDYLAEMLSKGFTGASTQTLNIHAVSQGLRRVPPMIVTSDEDFI